MTAPRPAASRFEIPWHGETTCRVEHYPGLPKVKFHYHAAYELTLLRGGAGKRIVGDHQASFSGEDLILVGPNLPHAWACHPHPQRQREVDFTVVLFTRESIGYPILEKREFSGPVVVRPSTRLRGISVPKRRMRIRRRITPRPSPGSLQRLAAIRRVKPHLSGRKTGSRRRVSLV